MTGVQWSNAGYQAVAQLLGVRAGLSFRASQRESIEEAIHRAMRNAGASDLDAYLSLLKADPARLDDLLVQATVGETYFFRDPIQLQIIRKQILPEICRQRDSTHKLRLWSAGCASGEEPYSLAMLLHRKGLLSRASVLGTDVSRESLDLARQATYRNWSLRGEGQELAKPYLTEVDGRYRVNQEIQRAVRFEYLNLALDNYPSTATGTRGIDLILCRNVMIYFDRETIRSVVARFHRCLAEGGWLVTAASDPAIHELDLFEVVSTDHGMVFRKGQPDAQRPSFQVTEVPWSSDLDLMRAKDVAAEQRPAPSTAVAPTADERLAKAKRAMEAGEYAAAATLAADLLPLADATIIHVKALANQDVLQAEQACAAATGRKPLSKELHYLHAVLLMELNRHADAAAALQRVLYLDRSLALPHYSLGTALRTQGDLEGARRAFRSAYDICAAMAPDELVPLGEDERVGDLLEITRLQLDAIAKVTEVRL
jgi:chemotaxis protein methyltransferase CheR